MTPEHPFSQWIDLAQPRLGAVVREASDEFFAAKERLIQPEPPRFVPDLYDEHGKWMDGWESRRRRDGGHDHCVIDLGCAGVIHGIDVDTSHFTGNFPPRISLEASLAGADGPPSEWVEIVPRQAISGDSHNYIAVADRRTWNRLRLNIFPDGGVARLRVYGEAQRVWRDQDFEAETDLAAIENGGRVIACNDMHFGHVTNLIAPGHAVNMGDGWETRRRREPGHDWALLALGRPGRIGRIVVETTHFKGNYPDRCSLDGARVDPEDPNPDPDWQILLPEQKLEADARHVFSAEIIDHGPVNRVRFNIIPDGGVGRLRLYGIPERP